MTEPDAPSPFRRVDFPPIPDELLGGSGFEDVIATHGPRAVHSVTVPEPRGASGWLADVLGAPIVVGAMTDLTQVRKMSTVVSVSAEELADAEGMREASEAMLRLFNGTATPEEKAAAEARRAAWKADRDARHATAVADWEQTRARHADSPAVLAVLDIHKPDDEGRLECAHPVFGWESDAEDWPCSTYEAIRDAP